MESTRRPEAVDGGGFESAEAPANSRDWSQLHENMLILVFSRLDLPDLIYSGATCAPWRAAYLAVRRFRLCSPNQSPYLVYSSGDRDGNTATLHNVSTDKAYHVPLPDPPFRSRYVIGASHGWLVTADEKSNLHLLNPVTGAQIALPPPGSIKGVTESFNSDGELIGHNNHTLCVEYRRISSHIKPRFLPPEKTRLLLYQRAVLSGIPGKVLFPSTGDCTVLLRHRPWDLLSFARVGDTEWTWLDATERCQLYHDFFNGNDKLFYAVREDGEVHTIDLKGPSPVVKVIFNAFPWTSIYTHYILLAPWDDLLQVRRVYDPPSYESYSDDEDQQNHEQLGDEDGLLDDGHEFEGEDEQNHEQLEGEDGLLCGGHESEGEDEETNSPRDSLTVLRVDLAEQKVTEIKDLQGHAIFVGFNNSFMVHTRDFPNLSSNCVYFSDDNTEYIYCHPFKGRPVSRVSLEDSTVTDLSFSNHSWIGQLQFGTGLTLREG